MASRLNHVNRTMYPYWMAAPGLVLYLIVFIVPTFLSFYFALTRWNLQTAEFIGLENFREFFSQDSLRQSLGNTFVYAFCTSLSKVIFGMFIALGLTGRYNRVKGYLKTLIYFPTLLGFVVVGVSFSSLMAPNGIINQALKVFGLPRVPWLSNPKLALWSIAIVDFWKGIGVTTVIYIAGIQAIPSDYFEAAQIDGTNRFQRFRYITFPLLVSSVNTVLTLSLIGGLKSYELILSMTEGGPGFSTHVLGLTIYKLFGNGMYGLATAGSMIQFIVISIIIFPLNSFITKREVQL